MNTAEFRPLEDVSCCRKLPDQPIATNRADGATASFRPRQILDGRFRIVETINRSGMATILKAEDTACGDALVAIKVPHLEYESDPLFFSRFQREEEIGLSLNHPYIMKFIEVPGEKSRPYIVTEYLNGCTLAHVLEAMRPLPEKDALKIASLVCDALQHMHDRGVVHRDLKPQNIMLCKDRSLRIMDFGIARDTSSRRITRLGNSKSMGTPDYMAPEQVEGKHADRRTDIYNLGALMYEMLTGSVPFTAENEWAALNARVTGDPVAPRKLNRDLSAQAEEIVLRALRRDPSERYASAREMKAELDCSEHVRVTGLSDRLQEPTPWKPKWSERPLVLVSLLIGPVVIGILAISWLLLRQHVPH